MTSNGRYADLDLDFVTKQHTNEQRSCQRQFLFCCKSNNDDNEEQVQQH
jgi:hypothetical protein